MTESLESVLGQRGHDAALGRLVSSSGEPTCAFEASGKLVYAAGRWNPAVERPSSGLVGKNLFELLHASDRARFASALGLARARRATAGAEARMLGASGRFVRVKWRLSYDSSTAFFYATAHVATGDRILHGLLERSLTTASDPGEPDFFAKATADLALNFQLDFASISEITPEASTPLASLWRSAPGAPLAPCPQAWPRQLDAAKTRITILIPGAGDSSIGEIRVASRTETPYVEALTLSMRILCVRAGAEIVRRRIEARLHALESLELDALASSKMAVLGEMAATLAHEINNPLAVVFTRSHQLLEAARAGRATNQQTTVIAEQIHRTADRIAKTVGALRSFSRDGRRDPFERCRLAGIFDETLELCAARFRHHEVDLEVVCPADLWLECRPGQVAQILLNLLGNALDAVAAAEEPQKWVRLCGAERGAEIEVTVADGGEGPPADALGKLMTTFFTTKGPGQGTGLGLCVSRALAEQHGGSLRFDRESALTLFALRLPMHQKGRP